jgi:hypothetical protein
MNNQDSGDTTNDSNIDDNPRSSSGLNERTEIGIFERFMDSVLGIQHRNESNSTTQLNNQANNNQSNQANSSTLHTTSTTDSTGSDSGSGNILSNLIEWTLPGGNHEFSDFNATTVTDNSNPSISSHSNNATLPGGRESEEARAIIITVNYVFSDENNPLNPNRSGSLVLSLPNNSSNRDPEFIQQLIRFATQMAYSSIINGFHKQKGLTKKTFNSYPTLDLKDPGDSKKCVICFEEFEGLIHRDPENDSDHKLNGENTLKRRKLDSKPSVPRPVDPPTDDSTNVYLVDCDPSEEHTPIKLPCNHIFGKSCLQEWLKDHTTCPLCRKCLSDPTDTPPSQNSRNLSMFILPNGSTVSNLPDISTNIPSRLRRILRSGSGLQETNDNQNSTLSTDHGPLSHILGYLRRQRQLTSANDTQDSNPNNSSNEEQQSNEEPESVNILNRENNTTGGNQNSTNEEPTNEQSPAQNVADGRTINEQTAEE